MTERAWQLPSTTGHEMARWVVVDVLDGDKEPTLVCNVALAGQIYSAALASNDDRAPWGYCLDIRGLHLWSSGLYLVSGRLNAWLDLPLDELRTTPLDLAGDMGGLFDQSLDLRLAERGGERYSGQKVATLTFGVGQMTGEMTYAVDQSCLKFFLEGIDSVLQAVCEV